jgi:hypothetical protein
LQCRLNNRDSFIYIQLIDLYKFILPISSLGAYSEKQENLTLLDIDISRISKQYLKHVFLLLRSNNKT